MRDYEPSMPCPTGSRGVRFRAARVVELTRLHGGAWHAHKPGVRHCVGGADVARPLKPCPRRVRRDH